MQSGNLLQRFCEKPVLRRFMTASEETSQGTTYLRFVGAQRGIIILCLILIGLGGAAFFSGISGAHPQCAWQAYLVNFLFWSGISFGAILFVAVMNLTNARWSRPIKRLAEAAASFLPVLFLLFLVLFMGQEELFPWLHEPVEGKKMWLNAGFLFARNAAGFLLLMTLSIALIYQSVRSDAASVSGAPDNGHAIQRRWKLQNALSPAIGILYAFVLSLIAFDLIMSLDPHWYSTLFGAYYFIGSFYTALAALIIITVLSQRIPGLQHYLPERLFHDLGKLLFGFCCMTGYLFYVQFLVIWYGNLPEETRYVILRIRTSHWEPLAWIVLLLILVIPFVILLRRKVKTRPVIMIIVSSSILIGMWLERYLMVAPSLMKQEGAYPGITEALISAGFLGAMALCVLLFLRKFPLLPLSDPLFLELLKTSKPEASDG
jgi:Ni/Fe-hydrogenase subunit HybB-like protein